MRAWLLALLLVTPVAAEPWDSFFAYPPEWHSGVVVADCHNVGESNSRWFRVTVPGPGYPALVRLWQYLPGQFVMIHEIDAYPGFLGGASVSCIVDGSVVWIATGAGASGGPHVRTFGVVVP